MNLQPIFSILAKDLKRATWFALPAIISVYGDRFLVFAANLENSSAQLASFVQWPLIFFVALALGAEDRAIGDRTFWRTRPISSFQVGLAKILGLSILLIVPIAMLEFIRASQHDVPLIVALAMTLERAGTVAVIALFGLLLGALTDSLLRAVAVIVVSVAVVMLAVIAGFNSWIQFLTGGFQLPEVSTASRITIGVILLIGSFSSLLIASYRFNSARWAAAGVVFSVAASMAIANAWRWQLVAEPSSPESSPVYEGDIDFSVQHFRDLEVVSMRGAQNSQAELGLSIHYDWNTPSLAINGVRKESKITLPNGSMIENEIEGHSMLIYYSFQKMLREELGLPRNDTFEKRWLKILTKGRTTSREHHLVTLPTQTLKSFEQQLATVETRFVLSLAEPKILSTSAPRSGERTAHNGEVFQTRSPKFLKNGDLEIPVLNSRATSLLYPRGIHRPDRQKSGRFYGFALVNRSRNEASISIRYGSILVFHQGAFPTRMVKPRFRGAESLSPTSSDLEPTPLDQAWLEEAELVIVAAHPIGEASQTVTFRDLKLPSPELPKEADPTVFIN
ncbi:MAG: hypothetical protein SynsKO_10440 [Synoicihabitans sp.]